MKRLFLMVLLVLSVSIIVAETNPVIVGVATGYKKSLDASEYRDQFGASAFIACKGFGFRWHYVTSDNTEYTEMISYDDAVDGGYKISDLRVESRVVGYEWLQRILYKGDSSLFMSAGIGFSRQNTMIQMRLDDSAMWIKKESDTQMSFSVGLTAIKGKDGAMVYGFTYDTNPKGLFVFVGFGFSIN